MKIPKANFAIIGGSSTYSLNFPEDLNHPQVKILEKDLVFETPWGKSPFFKLFAFGDKKVLTTKMHGWRNSVSRGDASPQVFYCLHKAGVKRIIAEGGVGSINPLLEPRDVILPTDYIDFTQRKDLKVLDGYLLIMRNPICPEIHTLLYKNTLKIYPRVFQRGVYAATEGYRFESRAEIEMLKRASADVVGQTMVPEVYLARNIGACYAGIYLVVNYAEGIVKDWEHKDLKDIFYKESAKVGEILLNALSELSEDKKCSCEDLRKPTLLK